MSNYIYLGYEKKTYTNKTGQEVTGYNFFYAYSQDSVVGFKPAMRFDSFRRSLGYCYLTEAVFERLGLTAIPPLSRVTLSFNQFGGVDAVTVLK